MKFVKIFAFILFTIFQTLKSDCQAQKVVSNEVIEIFKRDYYKIEHSDKKISTRIKKHLKSKFDIEIQEYVQDSMKYIPFDFGIKGMSFKRIVLRAIDHSENEIFLLESGARSKSQKLIILNWKKQKISSSQILYLNSRVYSIKDLKQVVMNEEYTFY